MKRLNHVALALLFCLLAQGNALADSESKNVIEVIYSSGYVQTKDTLQERMGKADAVVLGNVLGQMPLRMGFDYLLKTDGQVERVPNGPRTDSVLQVETVIVDPSSLIVQETIIISQRGGKLDQVEAKTELLPLLQTGERVVVFLSHSDTPYYPDQQMFHIQDENHGLYRVVNDRVSRLSQPPEDNPYRIYSESQPLPEFLEQLQ